jgi:UDP-N-acetylglucosamine 3-dehydrogenase
MADLRVGLIGLGAMGRHHARVLREVDGVRLVAVADASGDPHRVALGLPVLGDVDELIAAGIDAAVCAVPTSLHEEVGLALAEAGVHTLVEKPIAHSVEAGERLVKAFAAAGVLGAVGHVERYNPALQSLRARMINGDLGELYQIATRRQGPYPARIGDVGVVKDLATHDIDLTAWLARSEYQSVAAQVAVRAGGPYEDLVAATGRLADGTITNHLVNWLSPTKERVIVVTGAKGTFVADTLTADLVRHANGVADQWGQQTDFRGVTEGDITRFVIRKREPLRVEHERFRDAVLGRESEIVSMREGLATLRTAERLLAIAATAAE